MEIALGTGRNRLDVLSTHLESLVRTIEAIEALGSCSNQSTPALQAKWTVRTVHRVFGVHFNGLGL